MELVYNIKLIISKLTEFSSSEEQQLELVKIWAKCHLPFNIFNCVLTPLKIVQLYHNMICKCITELISGVVPTIMWSGGEHVCCYLSKRVGAAHPAIPHFFCGAERFSIELISVRNAKQVALGERASERMQHRWLREPNLRPIERSRAHPLTTGSLFWRGPSNNTHNEGFFRPRETSRATLVAPLQIIAGVLELHSARRRKH